jgi:hypothetical protein
MKSTFSYKEFQAVSYAADLIEDQCNGASVDYIKRVRPTINRLQRLSLRMRLICIKEAQKPDKQLAK